MDNKNTLDKILSSKDVKEKFYNECKNQEFSEWLINIIPEIADCANCAQNNDWHIYNVLDHSLVATSEINKLTYGFNKMKRKFFSYAMFLHDMGKPKSHLVIDSDGRQIDVFPNHEKESERIAKRVLSQLEFNEKDVDRISFLIANHDIFSKIVKKPYCDDQKQFSPELMQQLVSEYDKYGDGIQILKDIILIAVADNMAQNPEKTMEPLEVLAEAKLILNNLQKEREKQP